MRRFALYSEQAKCAPGQTDVRLERGKGVEMGRKEGLVVLKRPKLYYFEYVQNSK